MPPMRLLAAGIAALACACTGSDPELQPRGRVDLRVATGQPQVNAVGVTIDAAGDRYVFDADVGIYRLAGDGLATLVMPQADMLRTTEQVQLPFTDIAAVAPGQFAVTAIGDGYLVDVNAGTVTQHFCYVPDGTPAWLWQRTDALAYEPAEDRIYALPLTFDAENVFQSSAVAAYDRATGTLTDWQEANVRVDAGAMVVLPEVGVVLGHGPRLLTYDASAGTAREYLDLGSLGITDIQGLARDPERGTLLVVDGPAQALIELDLADL